MMIDAIKPWAQAMLATGAAVATVITYGFATFDTKAESAQFKAQHDKDISRIEKAVDRLEDKIDALLLKEGVRWLPQKDESRRR